MVAWPRGHGAENPAELGLVAQALAQDRGVQLGLVFGSVARGTPRPGSDVDVAVLGATDALKLDRPWYARQRNAWLKRVAERGLL